TGATPCIPQQCDKEMRLFCCFFISASHPQAEQLNASLSNIQWLGDMSSDSLGPCIKEESEKENQPPEAESTKMEDESQSVPKQQWPLSISERPPYSYMALIQFAINSTPRKRMTLKDIYTWIEDHFPYFKHVAKPGWKNSIRHNLSLHDMFVRETITNNKISYWTIHPQANRCLTLDQVFKVKIGLELEIMSHTEPGFHALMGTWSMWTLQSFLGFISRVEQPLLTLSCLHASLSYFTVSLITFPS
ncbi:hypothetical protein GDO86_004837, partial [Hymenochirus boettgeri]